MKNFFSSLENKRESIANWSMAMGSLIIFFLVSLLVTVATSFFLGLTIGRAQFIASLIMVLGLSFDLVNNIKIQGGGKNIGLKLFGWVCLLILVSIAIETPFYDISFDGQNYHQEGIIQLKEGWNPNYELLPKSVNEYTTRFTGGFAKGSWYIDTCFYAITGFIQSGKASNLLYIFAGILFSLTFLLKLTKLKVVEAIVVSILIGFNPIWANQYLSFYVDGQVSTCFIVIIACFIGLYHNVYNKYMLYLISACGIIILINLKFTGPVYTSILIFGFLLVYLLSKRFAEMKEATVFFSLITLIGIFYIGYGTYVTNFLNHGHPFYPLNTEDILSYQTPSNFKGNWSGVSLIQSIYSKSGQIDVEAASVYKLPFTFTLDELKIFVREEPRTGGFGIFFSGILILVLLGFLFVCFLEKKKPSKVLVISWLILLVSVLVNSAAWWARYVPQFYFLILWLAVWAYISTENKWIRNLFNCTTALLLINVSIIKSVYTFNNIQKTVAINGQLDAFKGKSVVADFGIFQATRMRFIEKGIPFEEAPKSLFNEKCAESAVDLTSAYSSVKLCVKK